MSVITAEDVAAMMRNNPRLAERNPQVAASVLTAKPQPVAAEPKRSSKFNAKRTEGQDGQVFDSKLEARYYYETLLPLKQAGEILTITRQVEFRTPAGTKYRADFVTLNRDGSVHVIDTKGVETPEFKIKKREIEHAYQPWLKIEVVK